MQYHLTTVAKSVGVLFVQATSRELHQQAAEGLGEPVDINSHGTLKPFVV